MRHSEPDSLRVLRQLALLTMPFYVLAVMLLNGMQGEGWRDAGGFAETLASIHWVPFHYHMRVSMATAVISFVAQSIVYAPLGLVLGLVGSRRRRGGGAPLALSAALTGLLAAAAVEGLRLWRVGLEADPTNLWIAAVSAALACHLVMWLMVSIELAARKRSREALTRAADLQGNPIPLKGLTLAAYDDLVSRVIGKNATPCLADREDGFHFACHGRHIETYYREAPLAGESIDSVYEATLAKVFGECGNGVAGVETEFSSLSGRVCTIGAGRCVLPSGQSMHLSVAVLDLGNAAAVHLGSGFVADARMVDLVVRALAEQQALG